MLNFWWQRSNSSAVVGGLGPAAWFRNQQGITQSGGFVSQWDDQSGNGRHLLQATGTNQPSLQADGSILFDGVDNFLRTGAFTLNQPFTYYLLARQVTWTLSDVCIDGVAAQAHLFQRGTTPGLGLFAGSGAATNNDLVVNVYGVVSAVFNGSSSVLQVNTGSVVTGDPGANNPGGISLGIKMDDTNPANIQVKEVVVYPTAHDAFTRSAIISYLATVGGISV